MQTSIIEMEHRFCLASNKIPKVKCPQCGAKNHWQRYVDIHTGEVLPQQYGRCDNEAKCGAWVNPYKDGYKPPQNHHSKSNTSPAVPSSPHKQPSSPPAPTFIPIDVLNQTIRGYHQNIFIQNLLANVPFPFLKNDLENVISQYYLGTVCNGYRSGAITFPFIDASNNIRAIQVKQFNQANHTTGTDFLHSIIEKHCIEKNKPSPAWLQEYIKNQSKVSCLFGEHLLKKYPFNPIGLVEAPKTAIYCTLYFGFPNLPSNILWLAVYNKSSLTPEKCKVLKGRKVILFPDLKAFDDWSNKAKHFSKLLPGTHFTVSDLLEKNASPDDIAQGKDIADYLIRHDWRLFRQQSPNAGRTSDIPVVQTSKPINSGIQQITPIQHKAMNASKPPIRPSGNILDSIPQPPPVDWSDEIEKLETFFNSTTLPTGNIKLSPHETITNTTLFFQSHIKYIKAQNGKHSFRPYLHRLQQLKTIINQNTTPQQIISHS